MTPDGSIQAGALRIVPLHPVNVNVVSLPSPEFASNAFRIELTVNGGCTFDVELHTW